MTILWKLWNNFSYFQLLFLFQPASVQLCMIFHRPLQYSFLSILFWILQIKGYKNPRILVGTLFYMVYYMRTTIKHKQCQEKHCKTSDSIQYFAGLRPLVYLNVLLRLFLPSASLSSHSFSSFPSFHQHPHKPSKWHFRIYKSS